MGYLTTITFRNDAYHEFSTNREDLIQEILDSLSGAQIARGYNYFSIGCEANPVVLQKPRHADDTTLYLHAGNTVIDISELNEYSDKNKWAINQAISEMEYHIKRLKKLKNK